LTQKGGLGGTYTKLTYGRRSTPHLYQISEQYRTARVEAAQGPKKRKANESQRSGDGLQREALGFGSVKTFVSGPRPLGHFYFTENRQAAACADLVFSVEKCEKTLKRVPLAGESFKMT